MIETDAERDERHHKLIEAAEAMIRGLKAENQRLKGLLNEGTPKDSNGRLF